MTQNQHDDPTRSLPMPVDHVADEQRPGPAHVYRSKDDLNHWIVEPPRHLPSTIGKIAFKGVKAQQEALTYAYEKYGNARFFPYSEGDHIEEWQVTGRPDC